MAVYDLEEQEQIDELVAGEGEAEIVLAVAVESVVGVYDMVLFADHMVQHLLLIMVAAGLLILVAVPGAAAIDPSLRFLAVPGALPIEGGIPIVVDGKIIGAIGVSGAASDQDAQCAMAGIAAALAK